MAMRVRYIASQDEISQVATQQADEWQPLAVPQLAVLTTSPQWVFDSQEIENVPTEDLDQTFSTFLVSRLIGRVSPFSILPAVKEEEWPQPAVVSFGGEDELWNRMLLRRPVQRSERYIVYRLPDDGALVIIQGGVPKYLYLQSIESLLQMSSIESLLSMESLP